MIKVGIVGGAGYTGGETIRLLLRHPEVELVWVHSNSQAGKPLAAVHRDLLGETELSFVADYQFKSLDALMLCMGHGESRKWLEQQDLPKNLKIIDFSQDFRLNPEVEDFVYGLPELQADAIAKAKKIANPGCFATAIQLALLPLAKAKQLYGEVHISAVTGSTGAGQSLQSTTHFTWRSANISVYKAFEHQHLGEIGQSIRQLQPNYEQAINFIPMRGNFTRGILASVYTESDMSLRALQALYQAYYQAHLFVQISPENPDLKQVVNTNKCLIYLEKHGSKVLIISMIDNLLKGAAGQAVQNLNLMFGLAQNTGLQLKPSAF